jgi:hypothetical protein
MNLASAGIVCYPCTTKQSSRLLATSQTGATWDEEV